MTSETQQKKQVQVLQRCIVNALEDVKAIDIQVFNTEHLSPLFERVIVASGNSNRQTKALAASVRDDVREEGFDKPRIEGEENGEWIIVDCGAAVVHIMQPAIRAYYRLEEIWGEKPVKLRSAAPAKPDGKTALAKATSSKPKSAKAKPAVAGTKKTPVKATTAKSASTSTTSKPASRKTAAKPAVKVATKRTTRSSSATVTKSTQSVSKPTVKRAASASTRSTAKKTSSKK